MLNNIHPRAHQVAKIKEPRPPIRAGDVLVMLNGDSVANMPFKQVGARLKKALAALPMDPITMMFLRPSAHAQEGEGVGKDTRTQVHSEL
jgi:hypothetical protein